MTIDINLGTLLLNLRELADRSTQERLWINGDENQMSSFTEAICGVFDDSALSRAIESGDFQKSYSRDALLLVKALDAAIDLVPENERPDVIVSLPAMAEVRKIAGELVPIFESV